MNEEKAEKTVIRIGIAVIIFVIALVFANSTWAESEEDYGPDEVYIEPYDINCGVDSVETEVEIDPKGL